MEECIPVYMVVAITGPLLTVITVLWRRILQQDARTEAMLDDFIQKASQAQREL